MGCGAIALLSVVGCVGLVGVGSYAVERAIDEERSRQASDYSRRDSNRPSSRPASAQYADDPFSDYEGGSFDSDFDDDEVGGWGDEAR